MLFRSQGKSILTPTGFKSQFNRPIGFVPILGPVEHDERLFDKEAARLALFNYTASRNFRNIWYHYPKKFEEFRSILTRTWPGMDIERPRLDRIGDKTLLHMFCPEANSKRNLLVGIWIPGLVPNADAFDPIERKCTLSH